MISSERDQQFSALIASTAPDQMPSALMNFFSTLPPPDDEIDYLLTKDWTHIQGLSETQKYMLKFLSAYAKRIYDEQRNCYLGATLYLAVAQDKAHVVRPLLSNPHLAINASYDGDAWTPLYFACKRNKVEIAEILLTHPRIDVTEVESERSEFSPGIQEALKKSRILRAIDAMTYDDLVRTKRSLPETNAQEKKDQPEIKKEIEELIHKMSIAQLSKVVRATTEAKEKAVKDKIEYEMKKESSDEELKSKTRLAEFIRIIPTTDPSELPEVLGRHIPRISELQIDAKWIASLRTHVDAQPYSKETSAVLGFLIVFAYNIYNPKDNHLNTAFSLASMSSKYNDYAMVADILFESPKTDINYAIYAKHPLSSAIENKNEALVKKLMAHPNINPTVLAKHHEALRSPSLQPNLPLRNDIGTHTSKITKDFIQKGTMEKLLDDPKKFGKKFRPREDHNGL